MGQSGSAADKRRRHGDTKIPKPVLIEKAAVEATVELDGSGLQVGVISTRDHGEVVDALATVCCSELLLKGVESHNLHMAQVALSTELPYAINQLISAAPEPLDAVVAIGCLVDGPLLSVAAVSQAVSTAIMSVSMETKTPVIYGVISCKNLEQARQCAGLTAKGGSFGVEWAQTAITMAWQNRED